MRARQQALCLGHELVVDLFAGGGGASLGIERGIGRPVDVAVNHDPEAVALHRANHPHTRHYCESVFGVDPVKATGGEPVGLLWASPDCTHYSRARGGKPARKRIRGIAWVVCRWARATRPRVILLENVEEFADWGPLGPDNRPDKARTGETFRRWVGQLERLGYRVEYRILRACDYGAPTIRRRLFVVARCDGRPIQWPAPSHAAPGSAAVANGRCLPWRSAAECINWSMPCPSIFGRRKPLVGATLRRIAAGVQRFVLNNPRPYLAEVPDSGGVCGSPFTTARHGERKGQEPRARSAGEPSPTVTATANGASLVAAFLEQANTGMIGHEATEPMSTIVSKGTTQRLIAARMLNQHGSDQRHQAADAPVPTICAGGTHAAQVAALLAPYYGSGSGRTGRDLREPVPTATAKARFQLVTVRIDGTDYVLTDIGMRLFTPRELYRAQGFPDDYVIDAGPNGRALTKTAQVRLCGNSVPPQWSRALTEANFTHERELEAA
ncbi:MAG: DNA (cytosine-5-)-methyltransferase [Proteobacteria bacterium SW_6_67_9]|nr:MAG: DNA (cytosine-5-)-methyltransferase [Proteobacteria bacterium SW_6_67_9]